MPKTTLAIRTLKTWIAKRSLIFLYTLLHLHSSKHGIHIMREGVFGKAKKEERKTFHEIPPFGPH